LDVAKSTIYRYIATLEQHGYVTSEGKTIRLSTAFLRLGNSVRYQKRPYRLVESVLKVLATDTEERANFYVEEFDSLVCIHRKYGAKGVKGDTRIGKRFPVHATAAGTAMLSKFSEGRLKAFISSQGLKSHTENTITDSDELLSELEVVREQSIAVNDEEYIHNLRALGTSISKQDGEVLGAISISGPTHRLPDDRIHEELKERLLAAKNEIELEVQYGDAV
jgi:DNA-binding IclR family transcriptional regulator